VTVVQFSSDALLLATGATDNTGRITSLTTFETSNIITHTGWIYSVCFSPDGSKIATGSQDKTAKISQIT